MVLEVFKAAITGNILTTRCHLTLKGMIELVSTIPTIHAGVFTELATVFVKAVEVQPRDGFEVGLIFWQLMSIVEQRWRLDMAAAKNSLTAILGNHDYSGIFEIVMGIKAPREGEDCHFFADTVAVFTRDGAPSAAVIDVEDRSIRFFAKSRWSLGIWGFDIKAPGAEKGLRFDGMRKEDFEWSSKIDIDIPWMK